MIKTLRHWISPFASRAKLALAWLLILVGLPLYITPIPIGIFLLVPGLYLLMCSTGSPVLLEKLQKHSPQLHNRLIRLLKRCRCPVGGESPHGAGDEKRGSERA